MIIGQFETYTEGTARGNELGPTCIDRGRRLRQAVTRKLIIAFGAAMGNVVCSRTAIIG